MTAIPQNKTAIVTGAGGAIGEAISRKLYKDNYQILGIDLQFPVSAKKYLTESITCDISAEDALQVQLASLMEKYEIGCLINCAGIAPAGRIVGREGPMPLEDFKRVIDVNLVGSFNMLRLVAADLSSLETVNATGERGVIISTASVAAFEGQIGQCAYSASKGGLVSLMLPAARELAIRRASAAKSRARWDTPAKRWVPPSKTRAPSCEPNPQISPAKSHREPSGGRCHEADARRNDFRRSGRSSRSCSGGRRRGRSRPLERNTLRGHVPDRRGAGEHHDEAVDADPASRRYAVLKGLDEVAVDELLFLAAGLVLEAKPYAECRSQRKMTLFGSNFPSRSSRISSGLKSRSSA